MKKLFSVFAVAMFATSMFAAYTLNNPIGTDGRYIVKWDWAANDGQGAFAASNDMQVDQTFTFVVDVTGTWLENWLKETPETAGATRGVAINKWTSLGDVNGDTNRLKKISGNLWGMDVNYAQIATGDFSEAMKADSFLYVYGQIFGFEFTEDDPGAGWWMWNDNEVDATAAPESDGALFAFGPYVGEKYKSADLLVGDWQPVNESLFGGMMSPAIYGYEVKGYAAPGTTQMGTIVYVVDNTTWGVTPKMYIWGDINNNDLVGKWPGAAPNFVGVKSQTSNMYAYIIATDSIGYNYGEHHLIFNNNNGGSQLADYIIYGGGVNYIKLTDTGAVADEDTDFFDGVVWQMYTSVEDVVGPAEGTSKMVIDGQLYIVKNGVLYNALGAEVR